MQVEKIPGTLTDLRRHSTRLTADVVVLQRCLRSVCKQKLAGHANHQAIAIAEESAGNLMARTCMEMAAVGDVLVQLGGFIDANLTTQKADLLGAGRRGVALPDGMPFLAMIEGGLEVPKAADGRALCGLLFMIFAAHYGVSLRAETEREQAEAIATRIAAAGLLSMGQVTTLQ